MSPRLVRDGTANSVGIERAPASAARRVRAMRPSSAHLAERPADAVVLQVAGDNVIAVGEDALKAI